MARSDGSIGDIITYPAQQKVSICGDANSDGAIRLDDVIYVINYFYHGGPAPEPSWVEDANCDWFIDLADVVILINYLFKGAPEPSC